MDFSANENETDIHEKSDSAQKRLRKIVEKARQARNSKAQSQLLDKSFGILRSVKQKKALSQSFVFRQACALSAKNKEIVSKYLEARDVNVQLEQTLRSMQHSQMALMIKLNSREVELDKCFEKLKKIEEERDELLGLLLKIKKMTGDLQRPSAKIEDAIPTAITFSVRSRWSRSSRGSITQPTNTGSDKWHPDLTAIHEKSHAGSISEMIAEEKSDEDSDSRLSVTSSSPSSRSDKSEQQQLLDEILELGSAPYVTDRKSRRRSSLFSLSSVDLNTATCDSGNSLRLSVEPDSDDEPGQDEPGVPPFVRVSAETAKNPDEDALIAETAAERSESPAQVDSERSPLAGADENKTILDNITMEVTDPLDSSIVLGEQTGKEKTLAVPESRVSRKVSAAKTKQKIARCDDLSEEEKVLQENEELHNKRRSKSKRQSSNNRGTSASVKKNGKRRSSKKEAPPQDLDFSFTDSFVINPDKKIKLREDIELESSMNKTPRKKLSDVTNECLRRDSEEIRSSRRRTAPISYKEPKLNRKMRRDF